MCRYSFVHRVKFYKTPNSASCVVGYVFEKTKLGGSSIDNKLFQTQHWGVACDFIASYTAVFSSRALKGGMLLGLVSFACLKSCMFSFFSHLWFFNHQNDKKQNKDIFDPNKLLTEYSMAYKHGISTLQHEAKDNLFWFTCKVMAAVQKKYKPIQINKPLQDYYHLVMLSNGVFGFSLQVLQWFYFLHQGEGGNNEKLPPPQVQNDEKAPSSRKINLEEKTQKAMKEYNNWHHKFTEIQNNKKCLLAWDIKMHCRQLENKKKEKESWKIMVKIPLIWVYVISASVNHNTSFTLQLKINVCSETSFIHIVFISTVLLFCCALECISITTITLGRN